MLTSSSVTDSQMMTMVMMNDDDDGIVSVPGLTPDSEHSVTVCAVEPNKHDLPLDLDNNSVSTSFFTLREGLIHRIFHFYSAVFFLFSAIIRFFFVNHAHVTWLRIADCGKFSVHAWTKNQIFVFIFFIFSSF